MRCFVSTVIFMVISLIFVTNAKGQSPKDSLLAVFNNDRLPLGQRRSALERINTKKIEISVQELYQVSEKIDQLLEGKITTDTMFFLQLDRALLFAKMNEIKTAEKYYDEAYGYFKKNKHLEANGFFFVNYANVKNQLGKNTEAVALVLMQIGICEKYEKWEHLSSSHFNLGNFLTAIKDIEGAKKAYDKALEIAEKHNLINIRIKYLESLGLDALDAGELEKAESFFKEAIKLSDIDNSVDDLINIKNNLGIVYEELGRLDEATLLYKEVEMMAEKIGNTLSLANVNLDKGYLEIKKKNFTKAIQFCTFAKENYLTLGEIYGAQEAYLCLYNAAKSSNDYKEALRFFVSYKDMSDSLVSLSNIQQITELRKNFEFEKEKEKTETEHLIEIAEEKSFQQLLWVGLVLLGAMLYFAYRAYRIKTKINEVISQQNKQLEKFNAANENLIYSLSHDIKEPMLGVQILLNKIKSDDKNLQNAAISIGHQVASINGIVNNLLQLKKSAITGTTETVRISEILGTVDSVLNSLNYKIQNKNLDIQNKLMESDQIALPISKQKLYLALLNLLTNAIKFSKEGEAIEIYAKDGGLYVRDYGSGIDSEMLAKLGSQIDSNGPNNGGSGLGLVLVTNILAGTGVSLTYANAVGGGAEVGLKLM